MVVGVSGESGGFNRSHQQLGSNMRSNSPLDNRRVRNSIPESTKVEPMSEGSRSNPKDYRSTGSPLGTRSGIPKRPRTLADPVREWRNATRSSISESCREIDRTSTLVLSRSISRRSSNATKSVTASQSAAGRTAFSGDQAASAASGSR